MERIYEYNPRIKLIVVFRNPILRAYSHWNMEHQRGYDTRNFSEAIRATAESKQHRVYSYVERGYYAEQLKSVYGLFPKQQVLCLTQEELNCNPQSVLNRIATHLDVGLLHGVEHLRSHERCYEREIDVSDVAYLSNLYKEDIAELESLLNWKLPNWRIEEG